MNILRIYTLDYLRHNKRMACAIMAAILLTTTMLSALCGLVYTTWSDNVRLTREEDGNWHGELFDTTYARDLDLIENYASVEATLIKGPWEVAQLTQSTEKRPYLILRDANTAYWDSMPEGRLITQGRVPQKPGEIALSKQYFDDFPDTQIGDVWTLPVGDRIAGGTALAETAAKAADETFQETGTKTYTIVGELDAVTPSTTPAYTAIGYLDERTLLPDDQITVYLRFSNMRDTYKELPKIAATLGWQTDEYGDYNLRYNATYLGHYLVFPPDAFSEIRLQNLELPLSFLTLAVLVVGVFVLIIHNTFAVSASARLTQLGILASVGATPRQIKKSVLFEGLILTVIPLPIGLFLGFALDKGVFWLINHSNQSLRDANDVIFTFGLPSCIPAIILTLVTVYLSALIPARRVSKMAPIAAIRQGDGVRLKKAKKHRLLARFFGLEGELSARALDARRRAYRTATLSLILSFVTLTSLFYIMSIQTAAESIYPDPYLNARHISFASQNGVPLTAAQMDDLRQTDGVSHILFCSDISFSTLVPAEAQDAGLQQADGSFADIAATHQFYPTAQADGSFRLLVQVIGLDDQSFRDYCAAQDIDPTPYYQDPDLAIFYNQTESRTQSTRRDPVYYPILDLSAGDTLTLHERVYDEDDTDTFQPSLTVGAFAGTLPALGESLSHYTIAAIVPMQTEQALAAQNHNRSVRGLCTTGYALVDTPSADLGFYPAIHAVSDRIEQKLHRLYGAGDYTIVNIADQHDTSVDGQRVMQICIWFAAALIALIGLSNIASTVSGSLHQRRREFAMLRSAGLSPHGLRRMLLLEALFLGLRPVLWSLPFQAAVIAAFLSITEITFWEYLPYFPVLPLAAFLACVLAAIVLCYWLGGRRLMRDNILDALRDDTL